MLSTSKLGVYVMDGTTGAQQIALSGPQMLIAFDPQAHSSVLQLCRDFKSVYSAGLIVLHVFEGTQDLQYTTDDNPVDAANDFWEQALASALRALAPADQALIDYVEGPCEFNNTPKISTYEVACWTGPFWFQLATLIADAGYKPVLGELPVGWLAIDNLDNLMPPLVPALRTIRALGGAWSYHAYTIDYTTEVDIERWYSLRYRQMYTYLGQNFPDLADMPMFLTEAGVDECGNPARSGWQDRGTAEDYKKWLVWFDSQITRDPYITAATIFQIGDSHWSSFNIEPIASWLASYLKETWTG
ncbi:MAG: hypothetical protein H0X37_14270 [Herpetosiphonaceae bacterium]|nr:hypothetical protein [Herpetosiphonaceae bacterium]